MRPGLVSECSGARGKIITARRERGQPVSRVAGRAA